MTALVENMVCPLCYRLGGNEHTGDCPTVVELDSAEEHAAYRVGFEAGSAQKYEVVDLFRSRLARVFAVFNLAEDASPELEEACRAENLLPIQKRGT